MGCLCISPSPEQRVLRARSRLWAEMSAAERRLGVQIVAAEIVCKLKFGCYDAELRYQLGGAARGNVIGIRGAPDELSALAALCTRVHFATQL